MNHRKDLKLSNRNISYLKNYSSALHRFITQGLIEFDGFHSKLGVCGNCIPIQMHRSIMPYFIEYLNYLDIDFTYDYINLRIVNENSNKSMIKFSEKLYTHNGVNVGEDFLFHNNYSRKIFVNWMIEKYS